MPDTTTIIHELKPLRPDAWLTQPDHWACSCGSAMWVDLTTAVCVDSGHHLGRFNSPRCEVAYTVNYSDSPNASHTYGLEFRFVKSGVAAAVWAVCSPAGLPPRRIAAYSWKAIRLSTLCRSPG